jgi:hypothetical protein
MPFRSSVSSTEVLPPLFDPAIVAEQYPKPSRLSSVSVLAVEVVEIGQGLGHPLQQIETVLIHCALLDQLVGLLCLAHEKRDTSLSPWMARLG